MSPPSSPFPPPVPEADLEARGWRHAEDRTKTVFEGFCVTVRSRTLVHEDRTLRRAVAAAEGRRSRELAALTRSAA